MTTHSLRVSLCFGLFTALGCAHPPAAPSPAAASSAACIYVSNEDSHDISVLEIGSDKIAATIPVGKRPRGIKVSPDGRFLYAAVSGSAKAGPGVDESTLPPPERAHDGIAVVDLKSRKVIRVLSSGQDPEAFDFSPDGKRIYVSNEDGATLSIVNAESGAVEHKVAVGEEPEGVTTGPDGRNVYVTCEADSEVAVVDLGKNERVARIATGPRPRSVAFTSDGRGFVTAENGGILNIFDAKTYRPIGELRIPGDKVKPMGLALSRDGQQLFVTTGRGGSVAFVKLSTLAVEVVSTGGVRPWGIAVSPDGRTLYTANGPSNDVSVIDVATRTLRARVPGGRSPWGVAVGPCDPTPKR